MVNQLGFCKFRSEFRELHVAIINHIFHSRGSDQQSRGPDLRYLVIYKRVRTSIKKVTKRGLDEKKINLITKAGLDEKKTN